MKLLSRIISCRIKRSQAISIDIILALSIFLLTFVFFVWAWNSQITRFTESNDNLELQSLSQHAAAVLLTQGVPTDWHGTGSVAILGIADNLGRVQYEKMSALAAYSSINYSHVKQLLGVLGPGYEAYVALYTYNGSAYALNTTAGMAPVNASTVAVTQRNVLVDDTWGILRVSVWVRS